jgi:hypothetical protein
VEECLKDFAGPRPAGSGEELWKNCRKIKENILRARTDAKYFYDCSPPPAVQGSAKSFNNSFTIFPRLEEFGASGLAWGRIEEEIIVE